MNKYYVILSIQLMLITGTTVFADPDMEIDTEEIREFANNFGPPILLKLPEEARQWAKQEGLNIVQTTLQEEEAHQRAEKECFSSLYYKFLKKTSLEKIEAKITRRCLQKIPLTEHQEARTRCYDKCDRYPSRPRGHNECRKVCNKIWDAKEVQFWKKAEQEYKKSVEEENKKSKN